MDTWGQDPLVILFQNNSQWIYEWGPWVLPLIEVWAVALAFHAIKKARTSQGAIAWSVALVLLPFVTIPLYLLIGRSKFIGHVDFRRKSGKELAPMTMRFKNSVKDYEVTKSELNPFDDVLSELAHLPWLKGNDSDLLINGHETFNMIFEAMDEAQDYILHQYFIIEENKLGQQFAESCLAASKRGVKVYLIYDAIGCYNVSDSYWDRLKDGGVLVRPFHITERRSRRLQINFRNHRKITVVDGKIAFFGGHNIGDAYLGRRPGFNPWRDTHVKLKGPAIASLQVSFLEDWFFVNPDCGVHDLPELTWQWHAQEEDAKILMLPSGPADDFETCGLMFNHVIHQARKRFWLASPYFIPDGKIQSALTIAALKGVDVRILLPKVPDHKMVYYARQAFYENLQKAGVKFYLYDQGFLHQKVFLLDNDLVGVGTANLDNRSFRLNFELTGLVKSEQFVRETESMLDEDFQASKLLEPFSLSQVPLWQQILVRVCRLFSPVL